MNTSQGWRTDWIVTDTKVYVCKRGNLGLWGVSSCGPGWNAEDLFESCNPEPDFESQWNNLGGLYGNIDGFITGAPRDVVGMCGSGTCRHGTRRVTVLSCWWLGSPMQGGVHSKLFDQCTELGNPKTRSRQGLDLWKDSLTCSHSFRVYDWSSW